MRRKMTPVTICALMMTLPLVARAEVPVQTQWGVVSEPTWPTKLCATLAARIISQKGSVDFYDADGKDTRPDHDRIQNAIDTCQSGAVKLVTDGAKDGFLTSPLTLKSGVTLWIDTGATLYASRDPKDYDNGPGDCGTANADTHKSCRSLIEGKALDTSGLVGDGKIDGRGGSLILSGPNAGKRSWWDVAWQSKQGLTQHVFRLVQLDGGSHLTLYGLTFENSPNFHLVPGGFDGITAWGIKILSPSLVYSRPAYACPEGTTPDKLTPATCFTPDTVKNTDGFDPSNSRDVLLAYSYISTGDDNVAVKAGKGALSKNQVYAHSHFYYGHGMSIGSETNGGAEDFRVADLALDGYDSPYGNGLRVKSDSTRGGAVKNIVFDGICMRNSAHPMVFDTAYSDKVGPLYPSFTGIVVRDFHYVSGGRFGGGALTFRGFEQDGQTLPLDITFDTVQFDGAQPTVNGGKGKSAPFATHFTILPGALAFAQPLLKASAADDVTVTFGETRASPSLRDCSTAFIPLKSVLADSPI